MAVIDWLVTASAILSGTVSLLVIVSGVVDFLTRGWVRRTVRRWLLNGLVTDLKHGLRGLREDHQKTQVFLVDLGKSHNALIEAVCDEHDIPEHERPDEVNTGLYGILVGDEGDLEAGDFMRGGNDD